jgi:hypothetical protein
MKIRIELDIEVTPWTREQLEDAGFADDDAEPDGDVNAYEIGESIAAMFHPDSEAIAEALAGSELFVDLGDATLIRAEVTPQ